jgi:hypothetical protein
VFRRRPGVLAHAVFKATNVVVELAAARRRPLASSQAIRTA